VQLLVMSYLNALLNLKKSVEHPEVCLQALSWRSQKRREWHIQIFMLFIEPFFVVTEKQARGKEEKHNE